MHPHKTLFLAALCCAMSAVLLSQTAQPTATPAEQQPSLADVARQTNKNKTKKAKVVVDDESLASQKGPFPDITGEDDNSRDILHAFDAYKKSHSDKELDDALHEWYERQDATIVAALHQNKEMSKPYYVFRPRSYEEYYSKVRTAQDDAEAQQHNRDFVSKANGTLNEVRNWLIQHNLPSDWIKNRQ